MIQFCMYMQLPVIFVHYINCNVYVASHLQLLHKVTIYCIYTCCKQQILCSTKLLRFLQIIDKTWKFSLLISMASSNMYCNLTKPRQFSLHSAKKPVNRKSFVLRRICCLRYVHTAIVFLGATVSYMIL